MILFFRSAKATRENGSDTRDEVSKNCLHEKRILALLIIARAIFTLCRRMAFRGKISYNPSWKKEGILQNSLISQQQQYQLSNNRCEKHFSLFTKKMFIHLHKHSMIWEQEVWVLQLRITLEKNKNNIIWRKKRLTINLGKMSFRCIEQYIYNKIPQSPHIKSKLIINYASLNCIFSHV